MSMITNSSKYVPRVGPWSLVMSHDQTWFGGWAISSGFFFGEEREPCQQHPASSEEVGHATAEQQEAAEHQAVGDDDPLEGALAQAEIALDRRQRNIHDRDVEHDDELRRAGQRENYRFAGVCLRCQRWAPSRS
jgi:hypothetical protein